MVGKSALSHKIDYVKKWLDTLNSDELVDFAYWWSYIGRVCACTGRRHWCLAAFWAKDKYTKK